MAVGKKAHPEVIKAVSRIYKITLAKSTHWSDVFNILMDGFEWEMTKKCRPDVTLIKLFKTLNNKSDLIHEFSLDNSEVWISNEGDWDWNLIWKTMSEWLIENNKFLNKPKKSRKKK